MSIQRWVPDWEGACMRQHNGGNYVLYADHLAAVREAYREGYSDHARSQQHWQDTHGAYRMADQATEPVTTTTTPEAPDA